MVNDCICDATSNLLYCPVHGIERVPINVQEVKINWEDDFIKEMRKQNLIKAKEEIQVQSSLHSDEVKVRMRANL